MFADITKMLQDAQTQHRAVASINIYSMESIRGALLAAQELQCPIILAFAARYLKNLSLKQTVLLARSCGEDLTIPFALHLDHCTDKAVIRQALAEGFDSVMFDGSALPYRENLRETAEIVRMAHDLGAATEAELGTIRSGLNSAEDTGEKQLYTQPEQAAEFVKLTGTDALAVSIGTVHGMYKGVPHIRLDILRAIHMATPVPLVLHGGSGTGAELLQKTILNGICKVNINTELSMACVEGVGRAIQAKPSIHLAELALLEIDLFRTATGYYLKILNMR